MQEARAGLPSSSFRPNPSPLLLPLFAPALLLRLALILLPPSCHHPRLLFLRKHLLWMEQARFPSSPHAEGFGAVAASSCEGGTSWRGRQEDLDEHDDSTQPREGEDRDSWEAAFCFRGIREAAEVPVSLRRKAFQEEVHHAHSRYLHCEGYRTKRDGAAAAVGDSQTTGLGNV